MLPLSPVPPTPYFEQLNIGIGRRTLAIGLALLIEALLLIMLFSFEPEKPPEKRAQRVSVVRFETAAIAEEVPEPSRSERQQIEQQPAPSQPAPEEPRPSEPAEPRPPQAVAPTPAPIMPMPSAQPPSAVAPQNVVRPSAGPVYGPPNRGGSSAPRDTERVGTAPDGEPLYAAAWYREPRDDELRGYLSTASGPGWGLIACRTAPDYRVEDCVGLDEYPHGSQINRAVLAAAWQFKVRPPRVGGRVLVGSWVRIRIDYGVTRR